MNLATCVECGTTFTRNDDEVWKRRCLPCWRRSKEPEPTLILPPAPPIDAQRIRQLLQLTHPDRHGGSALANEVTAWLLSQRSAVR